MTRRLIFAALLLTGCGNGSNSESLGTFAVSATRVQSCAEQGLLSVPEQFEYLAEMHRVGGGALHWNDPVVGFLAGTVYDEDGTFTFSQYLRAKVPIYEYEVETCLLDRQLSLSGVLNGTAEGGYSGFSALQTYHYEPNSLEVCAPLMDGPEPIADTLPCTVELELTAALAE